MKRGLMGALLFVIAVFAVSPVLHAVNNRPDRSPAPEKAAPEMSVILRLYPYVPPALEGVRACPVCGSALPAADVNESVGPKEFNNLIGIKLDQRAPCKVVKPEQSGEVYALDNQQDREKVKQLANEAGADAILYPVLLRYRERVGSSFAATQPAAVAFHIYLLDAKTLKPIWSGYFNEEQQPLFENVIKFKTALKRKLEWVRAGRLIQDGLNKVFRDFPACEEVRH